MKNQEQNLQYDETNTAEKTIADRIGQLETEVEAKRAELKGGGIASEKFREINTNLDEINDLKSKLRYESDLKKRTWQRYSDKMTAETFNRLYNERLHDDAVIADAEEKRNAVSIAAKHSIYRW